jgi:DNA repair protein RadC
MEIKIKTKEKITTPGSIARIMQEILKAEDEVDQDKEHFWTIGLNVDGTIKYIELVALGILNRVNIHPREVFRFAIMKAVDRIIIAHNHLSEDLQSSKEDIKTTTRLREAGKIIGIELIDHIIINKEDWLSLNWEKML